MIIAIDPGKTTGYAVFNKGEFLEFGTIEYSPKDFRKHLVGWLAGKTAKIIVEDWENQGRRVNIHASTAVRAIGWVEMLAERYSTPVELVKASKWQVEFAKNGGLIEIPVKVPKPCRNIAGAVYHHLKAWPFEDVAAKDLGHVLDAVGLALWEGAKHGKA